MALTGWSAANYLTRAASVRDASPLLFSGWVHHPQLTSISSIVSIGREGSSLHRRAMIVGGSAFNRQEAVEAQERSDQFTFSAETLQVNPFDEWVHASGWFLGDMVEALHNATDLHQNAFVHENPLLPGEITRIGYDVRNSYPFAGALGEISIWDTAGFTYENRRALDVKLASGCDPLDINADASGPWTGRLVAYWPLRTAEDILDASGNGHDMTLVGALTEFASHPPIVPCEPVIARTWQQCAEIPPLMEEEIREFQGEFDTATARLDGTSVTRRPDAVSLDYLTARCIGPVWEGDPTAGLLDRTWMIRVENDAVDGGSVYMRRASRSIEEYNAGDAGEWEPETLLFSYTGPPIEEVDIAFEQNGRAVIAAERQGRIWLYWFDPRVGSYSFVDLAEGRTPRVLLDDPQVITDSDVLLFYVSDDADQVLMRQQRDLFETVYPVPILGSDGLFLEEVARATNYRMQVIYSRRDATSGTYSIAVLESAPYPFAATEGSSVQTRISLVETVEVVLPADWQHEEFGVATQIASVGLEELLIVISSEGPDGYLPPENFVVAPELQTLATEELVINGDQGAVAELMPRNQIATVGVVEYVIAAPPIDEGALVAGQITSITLAAV